MTREKAVEISNLLVNLEDVEFFKDDFQALIENSDYEISDSLYNSLIKLIDDEIKNLKNKLENI